MKKIFDKLTDKIKEDKDLATIFEQTDMDQFKNKVHRYTAHLFGDTRLWLGKNMRDAHRHRGI